MGADKRPGRQPGRLVVLNSRNIVSGLLDGFGHIITIIQPLPADALQIAQIEIAFIICSLRNDARIAFLPNMDFQNLGV